MLSKVQTNLNNLKKYNFLELLKIVFFLLSYIRLNLYIKSNVFLQQRNSNKICTSCILQR